MNKLTLPRYLAVSGGFRRFIIAASLITGILIPSFAKAETVAIDGIRYVINIKDHSAYVGEGQNVRGDVTLRSSVEYEGVEYPVWGITHYAFKDCTGLTSIVIPSPMTRIGVLAFWNCTGLRSVVIGNSVNWVGENAFLNCTGLIRSTYPEGLDNPFKNGLSSHYPPNDAEIVDGFVFVHNREYLYFAPLNLKGEYVIPNTVTTLCVNSFALCEELTSIVIPSSVVRFNYRYIDWNVTPYEVFSGCTGLKKSAYPDNLESESPIYYGVKIAYPAKGTKVKDGFVYSEKEDTIYFAPPSLSGDFEVPNSVSIIGNQTFESCTELKSVILPNTVTSIGSNAFANCSGLEAINIPSSVTNIGERAFKGCSTLQSMVIPNYVASIGNEAFKGCNGLIKSAYPDYLANPFNDGFSLAYPAKDATIQDGFVYGPELKSLYFAPLRLKGAYTVPNHVTNIGDYAFYKCKDLTAVELSKGVSSIGNYSFSETGKLAKVVFSEGLESIGEYAFHGSAPSLELAQWPSTIKAIKGNAFLDRNCIVNISDLAAWCKIDFENEHSNPCYRRGELYLNGNIIEDLNIPESVDKIGRYAFCNNQKIKRIKFPLHLKSIGDSAFYSCAGLTSVVIPYSVDSVAGGAFKDCWRLKKGAYPDKIKNPFDVSGSGYSYPSQDATIEDGVVYNVDKTKIHFVPYYYEGKYEIPNYVRTLGGNSFKDCSLLTTVVIPNSVTRVEDGAFERCSGLTHIKLPNNLSEIGNSTFSGCTNLAEISLPNSITTIGDHAFYECRALQSLDIPNSVGAIGNSAFESCTSLESITLSNSLGSIGWSAFWGCTSLTSVVIPNSVRFIFSYAFTDCSSLNSVTISNSKTEIYSEAFWRCPNLKTVKCLSSTPPTMRDNSFSGVYDTAVLSVPSSAGSYYLATNWSLFKTLRIGDVINEPKPYFDGVLNYRLMPASKAGEKNRAVVIQGEYSSLTEVMIPERFTVEEDGLSSVRYYVDGVGYQAFQNCINLSSVTFHSRNNSKSIGEYAFYGCSSLTSTNIPPTVTEIGNYAFYGCNSLTSIIIPNSVVNIGDYAFYNADNLKNLNLGNGLVSIGERAFASNNGRNVGPIDIPSSLRKIGDSAFYHLGCSYVDITDLTAWCRINFGNADSNPAAHGSGLYLNGIKIEKLEIPESIESIKDYAFYKTSLKSVKCSKNLQSIGEEAFSGCNHLSEIKFNNSLEKIGKKAFYGSYDLVSLTIPGSVVEIGDDAFTRYSNSTLQDLTLEYGTTPLIMSDNSFRPIRNLSCDRPLDNLHLDLSSLLSLTIGNNVLEIPAHTFSGAPQLSKITFGGKLKAIGDGAFSIDRKISEVIVSPSVESIGASAFNGDHNLTSIVMGPNVKTIGERAFNGCLAKTVSITAQTPPQAPNNTFSNYTGTLRVQGKAAVDAYYDAYTCWDRFNAIEMIEPERMEINSKTISGKPGEKIKLTAKLYPENVTLPQIFWHSTNPEIATVDNNGIVTIHQSVDDVETYAMDSTNGGTCKIVAESLYANGPVMEVAVVAESSGVEDVGVDSDSHSGDIDYGAPMEVYNLQGYLVSNNVDGLAPGIYIIRQGSKTAKILIQ